MIKLNGEKLRQWDVDRTVEIVPRHGKTLDAVRFWKSHAADPLTVAFGENGGAYTANIPNVLLRSFGTLTVEAVVYDDCGNYSEEKIALTVSKRKKPDDYVYTETEVLKPGSGGTHSPQNGGAIVISSDDPNVHIKTHKPEVETTGDTYHYHYFYGSPDVFNRLRTAVQNGFPPLVMIQDKTSGYLCDVVIMSYYSLNQYTNYIRVSHYATNCKYSIYIYATAEEAEAGAAEWRG